MTLSDSLIQAGFNPSEARARTWVKNYFIGDTAIALVLRLDTNRRLTDFELITRKLYAGQQFLTEVAQELSDTDLLSLVNEHLRDIS